MMKPGRVRPANRSPRELVAADLLHWQSGFRIVAALLVGAVAVSLRAANWLQVPGVAATVAGESRNVWLIACCTVAYMLLMLGIRARARTRRRSGEGLPTLMVGIDILFIFSLTFLLANAQDYHRALIVALFSLQLTLLYFGRTPALLLLGATAACYLLLIDIALRRQADVLWSNALVTLLLFGVGAALVTWAESNLHERLDSLVAMFERAESGDFTDSYDVAADRRPDAITAVGRAYNRMRGQLASIVLTDPLSGCFNRRGFEQEYRRELARAARTQTPIALLALDLDHFKNVNDSYGHLTGDAVIAETGALLRANARAQDVVARTGGEEFTILAPDTPIEGAVQLAERIVRAFRSHVFVGGVTGSLARSSAAAGVQIHLTVSVGVVADEVADDSIAEALRARADEALYAAKRAGRDRVVAWSERLRSR